jgi:hypothetical protein
MGGAARLGHVTISSTHLIPLGLDRAATSAERLLDKKQRGPFAIAVDLTSYLPILYCVFALTSSQRTQFVFLSHGRLASTHCYLTNLLDHKQ